MADMSINAEFTANSKNFEAGIKKCQGALSNFGKSLGNATSKVSDGLKSWGINFEKFYSKGSGLLKDFGINLDTLAGKLGVSGPILAGIATATVALTKLGQEFNGAMAEIVKGTGATGESLTALNQNLQNLMASGVGAPVKELGVMIADLNTRFGSTGEELETLTDQFDMFAGVTGQDAHTAINNVADVIKKWGMETKDIKPLLDQLTKAGQDSGISVQVLTQTLNQSKTIFSQFGMSVTTSIAFMEQLAKSGIDTNTAMTGMRFALAKFATEGKDAQKAFQEVSNAIKNAESDTEALNIALDTFGSKSGAEMINVFRNSAYSIDDFTNALMGAGGVIEATDEASRTSLDAIEDLANTFKGTFAGFGQGFDYLLRDVVDSIQSIVSALSPVIQPIGNIFRDIVGTVGGAVKQIVSFVVELHTRFNFVFQAITEVLSNVYKSIHKILNNLLDIFKNAFALIFDIIDGKWSLAWERTKNILLKIVDSLLEAMSLLVRNMRVAINGVIALVNGVISAWNLLQKALGKTPATLVDEITENFDLSESLGLNALIEESNAKIAKLSGETAKTITGDLGKVKNTAIDVTTTVEDGAIKTAETVSQWEQKLVQQEISRLKREKENATIQAENEEKTEAEIYEIKKSYDDKIVALQIKNLELERKSALAQVTNAKEIADINTYYDNEVATLKEKNIERLQKIQEKASQWEQKLLAQRISMLEQEENLEVEKAKEAKQSERSIHDLRLKYGEQIIALKIKQLEQQKAADLETATSEKDKADIVRYYENEITILQNTENQKRKENHKELVTGVETEEKASYLSRLKNAIAFTSHVASVFAKMGKTLVKDFVKLGKTITTVLTKALSKIATGLKKLFDFDTDEALDSLLEYEDKVLTFFATGMQKIPQFVNSAVSSIDTLVKKISNIVTSDKIKSVIDSVINTLTTSLPSIISNIVSIFTKIVTAGAEAIVSNADKIVDAFGQAVLSILDNLPVILKSILTVILTLIKSVAKYISDNAKEFTAGVVKVVTTIIDSLVDFLEHGGVKQVLNAIVTIIKALNKAITDNFPDIVDAIIDALPEIVDAIIDVLKDIGKSADKIMQPLVKLIVAIINALLDLISDQDTLDSMVDAFEALVEAIAQELIPRLPEIIIKIVMFIIQFIVREIPQLVKALVKGLINGFKKADWGQIVKDIFSAFINGIKKIFGIHSPSKLFESFGQMMVAGLKNGLSQIWDNVKGIFEALGEKISSAFNAIKDVVANIGNAIGSIGSNALGSIANTFSNIGQGISNAMSSIYDNVSSWVSSIGDKIGSVGSGIGSLASSVGSSISSGIKKVGSGIKSAVSKLKFWATGTPSAPAGLSIVGENGPELVRFRGGEKVYNAHNTEKILAGSSGTNNSFNITFNNTSQTTAFTVMREIKRYSKQLAFNGVL